MELFLICDYILTVLYFTNLDMLVCRVTQQIYVVVAISQYTCGLPLLLSDPKLPAQKLAALQKILESDFFNAVREVYEHVYETVDISGDAEVRASATAKVIYDFSNFCEKSN